MASESGREDPPVAKRLLDEPYRFDFFQAVRLLERVTGQESVGRDVKPSREAVRFRTRASLEFPASQIHEIKGANGNGDSKRHEMTVAFMGTTGPLGVLPTPYTALVIQRANQRKRDTALWEFLDIFNHRLISHFFRAWEKHRFAVAYERGREDAFTGYLLSVVGMGTGGLRGRSSFEDQALVFYGGLVAQQPHSASAVESVLGDYFGVGSRVDQFVGQWLKLDEGDLTRLGKANNRLGDTTIAGSRVWDSQSKFRLGLGPLTLDEFRTFLPVGTAFGPASQLVRHMAGLDLDFDVQLTLRADEVPGCVLGADPNARPMLGWTSWLKTRPFERDDSQVVLTPSV